MDKERLLREGIKGLAGENASQLRIGKVLSVNGALCEVELLDTGATVDARLRAADDGQTNGLLIVPAESSTVIVARFSNALGWAVIFFSEVDSVQFRNPDFGGLVKVETLTERLNALENGMNTLQNLLKTHVHPSNGAPSPTLAALANIEVTQREILENKQVTHG